MPTLHSYGVSVSIQLSESQVFLDESSPTITWEPAQGMTHPICGTTVTSPLAPNSKKPIPFSIVLEISPEDDAYPQYLKGDLRIEVKIDGIVRHMRVMPKARVWPTGVTMKFSGSRVGRTEERAFIFVPVPRGGEDRDPSPLPAPSVHDPSLVPHLPSFLPPLSSHIQVLLTLGVKNITLEKYLIASPLFQVAYYRPPGAMSSPVPMAAFSSPRALTASSSASLVSVPPRTETKRRVSPTSYQGKEKNYRAGTDSSPLSHDTTVAGGEGSPSMATSERGAWRPIGLANATQKTAQMKEASFSGRLHLARFWFIVVPPPGYLATKASQRSQLKTKVDRKTKGPSAGAAGSYETEACKVEKSSGSGSGSDLRNVSSDSSNTMEDSLVPHGNRTSEGPFQAGAEYASGIGNLVVSGSGVATGRHRAGDYTTSRDSAMVGGSRSNRASRRSGENESDEESGMDDASDTAYIPEKQVRKAEVAATGIPGRRLRLRGLK